MIKKTHCCSQFLLSLNLLFFNFATDACLRQPAPSQQCCQHIWVVPAGNKKSVPVGLLKGLQRYFLFMQSSEYAVLLQSK